MAFVCQRTRDRSGTGVPDADNKTGVGTATFVCSCGLWTLYIEMIND